MPTNCNLDSMQHLIHIIDNNGASHTSNNMLAESVDLHKISHPVRMAMQHYSAKPTMSSVNESKFKQLYKLVESEQLQKYANKKQKLNQHATVIAEKVMANNGIVPSRTRSVTSDKIDSVTVDVPLLIRLLEYSREDAKTDMDLHRVTEKMISLSKTTNVLTMDQYDAIVGTQDLLPSPPEQDNNE